MYKPKELLCFRKCENKYRTYSDRGRRIRRHQGVITIKDTITAFAQTTAVQAPGGIIVISMDAIDYSLAELARLVESNNARVLSSSIKQDSINSKKLKVTLKINQQDLSAVIATLERFEYKVIARFQEKETDQNDQERIDILLRYLDI